MKNIMLTLVVAISFGNLLVSQNFKDDLLATQRFFQNEKEYHIQLDVKNHFADKSKTEMLNRSVVKRLGVNFRYEMKDFTSLVFPDRFLVINDQTKEMIYRKMKMPQPDMGLKLDYLYEQIDAVEFKGVQKGQKQYLVMLDNPFYEYAKAYCNESTGLLSKVQYYFADPEEDKPIYLEQNIHLVERPLRKSEFQIDQYLVANQDKFIPNGNFKDYALMH